MDIFRGCELPEDLYYDIDRDVWVRFHADGTATLGMTDLAQTLSGKVVTIQFRRPGRTVAQGRAAATIESAKWVGPFPVPFGAEIVAANEEAFARDILVANRDPYGEAWIVRVRPTGPESERAHLITGEEATKAYSEKITKLEVHCFRCED